MRRIVIVSAILLLFASAFVAAEISFPKLTGRVVDNANLIDAGTEQELTNRLAAHEQASTNQLVIVTLPNLQGVEIEDFGYQLGRTWGIGQKDKNNGALLIVAEEERKVRIEVGYGLEGELTDAISANIIQSVILPQFRQGKFNEGIQAGAYAIIEALGNQYEMREPATNEQKIHPLSLIFLLAIFIFFPRLGALFGLASLGRGGRGGFGGGGFGGGFGGGGGGFGGGGASGGW
jgi:uncharacterized protein